MNRLSHVGVSLGSASVEPYKARTESGHRRIRGGPGWTTYSSAIRLRATTSSEMTAHPRAANAAARVDFPAPRPPTTATARSKRAPALVLRGGRRLDRRGPRRRLGDIAEVAVDGQLGTTIRLLRALRVGR